LKTLIADVPEDMGSLVSEKLTSRLLNGITRTGSEEIKRECLDNMADLLRRFGHLVGREHDEIMNVVVRQLDHEKPVIRKRAAVCLGSLAVVSSDVLLNRLVEIILEKIEASEQKSTKSTADVRTLIQTIGTISRTVGYRLGRHLDRLIPLFLRFCGDPEDENQQTDSANELRENCFPGLESFVLRCPREVSPYLPQILATSISFMKYDPNYSYDDEEGGDGMDEGQEDEDQGYDEEDYGGGSDDDDTSWKVVRLLQHL
jgi:cullin-associated NEDD8-dissociated protein 1